MAETRIATLEVGTRRQLARQREVSRWLSPLVFPLVVFALRGVFGYRIENLRELRREYARIRLEWDGAMLVCANHLTMVDSFIVGWALGSVGWYLRHFRALPWNTPEATIFAATPLLRALMYVFKCIPIQRGGARADVSEVLARVTHVLSNRETALMFPEGGRSRTGRIEVDSAAIGVGRVYRAVPGCRVLCVYLRGDHQESYGGRPVRGERFVGSLSLLEPKSDNQGLRGSRDVARQITGRLAEMEQEYFDARQ